MRFSVSTHYFLPSLLILLFSCDLVAERKMDLSRLETVLEN
ncbi:hypothetical protein [Leptospira wolffii]|nr:hypothetical protein [Leptospira wolffii]